jgi:antitoxin PrlF
MSKILHVESTLTDRYQTTIPEPVREILHLSKRDKITYVIDGEGKVLLSRANDEDPVVGKFLAFLAKDIENNPQHVQAISSTLYHRIQSLVAGMEVDLDAPLSDEDE